MIFSTLETIKSVMETGEIIRWKVVSSEEQLMQQLEPPATTPVKDSFAALETFLNGLKGSGYVQINLYDKKYKSNGGGALGSWVYKHFYNLSPAAPGTPAAAAGINNNSEVHSLITDLKVMIVTQQKDFELQQLKSEIESLKKQGKPEKNNFDRIAGIIGKSFAQEFAKANGYTVTGLGEGEEPEIKETVKHKEHTKETTAENNTADEIPTETKDIAKRASGATYDIMKSLTNYGVPMGETAKGFEDLAKLAETNPLKFKALLESLNEAE